MRILRRRRTLRPGDLVEVRPAAEILATLDRDASLDALPFMPEMVPFVGRRFRVWRRVEKICDTVSPSSSSRRMYDTVFLDDLRCDGSGHDGCGAACRLYWKEAWLRRVDPSSEPAPADPEGLEALGAHVRSATKAVRELDGERVEVYRCQATQAKKATEPLRGFDPRQYVREVTSGNVGPLHASWVLARAVVYGWMTRLRLRPDRPLPRTAAPATQPRRLDLRPGELVQIRSREEVAATLDAGGKCRGLWFDVEMAPYCGELHRVRSRVERFIDETNGRMVELGSDCLILDGVVCSGERSNWRYFCHRQISSWWREAWLRRVEEEQAAPGE